MDKDTVLGFRSLITKNFLLSFFSSSGPVSSVFLSPEVEEAVEITP